MKQLKITVDASLISSFKDACDTANLSMASVLARFMADFAGTKLNSKSKSDFATRRLRRAAIKAIIKQHEQIRDWELRSMDNTPINLQGTENYERADELVNMIDEVIDLLKSY